jgi:molecular chaperone GrpE
VLGDGVARGLQALLHLVRHRVELVPGVDQLPKRCVLAALGYPRRDDEGIAFDPTYHEAVSTVEDEELPPGTVARVVRPGYGSEDEVLRPAAVVVATRGR